LTLGRRRSYNIFKAISSCHRLILICSEKGEVSWLDPKFVREGGLVAGLSELKGGEKLCCQAR